MPLVALDYPKARVMMDVQTPIEASFRVHACAKEPWTVAFIESMHRGDVLWDIGANVGSYALLAGALGYRAVAIEPIESNFAALTRNMQVNTLTLREKIIAVRVALGASTGTTTMVQQDTPGYGEGGEQGPPEGRQTRDVQQVTLDDLVTAHEIPFPTHLKIDVDGHELGVLAGAEKTLRQPTPLRAVLIEVQRSLGPRVDDLMALWGWRRTASYDERNGQRIPDMTYGLFERMGFRAEDVSPTGAGETSSATPTRKEHDNGSEATSEEASGIDAPSGEGSRRHGDGQGDHEEDAQEGHVMTPPCERWGRAAS